MTYTNELRLVIRVARMYYEFGRSQPDIAHQLGMSQATVSRLLNRAKEEGIIRISINVPGGIFVDIEEQLIQKYGLRDAIVVESHGTGDERTIQRDLGTAAAYYVENVLSPNEIVGISSWSGTLLAMVDAMHPLPRKTNIQVVQVLGGVGNPSARVHANRLTSQFADRVKGRAVFLPVPGILGSESARNVLLSDPYIREPISLFDQITLALVGIGSIDPSPLLQQSGNIFSEEELGLLRRNGAVGDILLRFFGARGDIVITSLADRVISMTLPQLCKVSRAVGIAGGKRKYEAIRGALIGKWINILVTDYETATRLVDEPNFA